MKYLIVEDERFAAEELKRMMTALRPGYVLEKRTKTVIETITFLKTVKVDLILLDIRLADGSCFEIFNHVEVKTPVIFTTAYDEHAIRAFKLNSIDYLLKPFEEVSWNRPWSSWNISFIAPLFDRIPAASLTCFRRAQKTVS
ncbi:LytR/AlgR family response regulator transcription factor [Dyadobacter fermentans]|uniref:Response regulator receiver protein n=1 Tax=Dyadobacter fermentans (strain ATCC 700827 / DSM 18053 / CIP 107007 / KCTC 52180 / NS114) TaxID=471854 RepID=C6W2E0_DYAFD|nr:response regulator [Dyadobacter fermentans]ACT92113.1 response regulator receiver protein [Dyadobacter fermentans DSM 18053]